MVEFVNECWDCGLPCLGAACPSQNVPRLTCDKCNHQAEKLYWSLDEAMQLCGECALEELDEVVIEI